MNSQSTSLEPFASPSIYETRQSVTEAFEDISLGTYLPFTDTSRLESQMTNMSPPISLTLATSSLPVIRHELTEKFERVTIHSMPTPSPAPTYKDITYMRDLDQLPSCAHSRLRSSRPQRRRIFSNK
ncbi:hypothetical protein PCANC_25304 [Puccinia coronata f. sp. avenae]|nr:hypothetical protein PCANC_25304 [Puccinia coronata f. sp. avenae]